MNAALTAVRLKPATLRLTVAVSLVFAALSGLLWVEGDIDRGLLLAHNRLRDDPAVAGFFGAVSRFGMSAICLLLVASAAASYRSAALAEVRPALLVALFSFAAACLAGPLLKELFGRPRPMVELLGQLNAVSRHGSASFPSGHAAQSLALTMPFILLVPSGPAAVRFVKLALLAVASLVGYSRVVLGAHYLSDVLAGAALALVCVPVAMAGANAIYARGKVTPEKLNQVAKRFMVVLFGLMLLLPFL